MVARYSAFVFTLNNPAPGRMLFEDPMTVPAFVKYGVYQLESAPTTGTPHFQGFIDCNGRPTLNTIKVWLSEAVHVEHVKGTKAQARAYAMKEDTRVDGPWEFGEWSEEERGKRTDIDRAVHCALTEGLAACRRKFPGTWIRYERAIRKYVRDEEAETRTEHFVPRVWQKEVLGALQAAANDRTILWVTDAAGNTGKSRLARHLAFTHTGLLLSGKLADMSFALSDYMDTKGSVPRVVIFDITRAQADYSDHLYSFAESVKNGMVFTTKYESRQLILDPIPHVLFLSNFSWDRSKFSHDRVKEWNLATMPDNKNDPAGPCTCQADHPAAGLPDTIDLSQDD